MFVSRFEKAAQQNVRPYAMAGQAAENYSLFLVERFCCPPRMPAAEQVRWEFLLFLVGGFAIRPHACGRQVRWVTNMRYIFPIISLMIFVSLASCRGQMYDIKDDYATPVIRTDFTDEAAWKKLQREITATNIMGFSANVRFIDNEQYSELSGQELLKRIPKLDEYGCIFIADATAMSTSEHHLLVLDPSNPTGKTFRVIPSEAWGVENNLAIANMDYSEFADSVDSDGVFRGFK